MRISLADPVSYTIPYDRSLAEALARRGHEVDLFAASFPFAELPPPNGYRQHDVFFTRSARFLRGNPTALTPRQLAGMNTFFSGGANCMFCHAGPELTAVTRTQLLAPGEPGMIELMAMADGLLAALRAS